MATQIPYLALTMSELFVASYVLLCGLVLLEAVVLREALRGAVWFKRFYANFGGRRKSDSLPLGSPAPEFAARVLGTGQTLRTSDLRGHSTILLFVSPVEASLPLYQNLAAGIHALWHKAEGHLYLVCSGSEGPCRQVARDHHVEGFTDHHVPIILDQGARIARSFLVSSTPQAVMLDQDVRVSRYGRPVQTKKVLEFVTEEERNESEPANRSRLLVPVAPRPAAGKRGVMGPGMRDGVPDEWQG